MDNPTRRDRYKSTYEEGRELSYVSPGFAAYEIAFKSIDEAMAGDVDGLVRDMFSLADIGSERTDVRTL